MPLNMNEIPKTSSKQRALITAGQHAARIVRVIDFGLQTQRPYKGEEKSPAFEIMIEFEFPDERIEIEGESRPMWKSRKIKVSSDERSICYKWYNKLDPENVHRGDWSKLVGKECAVLIVHEKGKNNNEGRVFDKIGDIMPIMKGMKVPPLENDPVVFDLGSPDMEVFASFPEWMQNKIKENLQFDGSKLQTALEGRSNKYTARAEGDGPEDYDSDDDYAPQAPEPASPDVGDGDDVPW